MSNTTAMQAFVELSAVLTGFSQDIIAPNLDPTDIKSLYLETWLKNVAEESGDDTLGNTILNDFSATTGDDQRRGETMLDDTKKSEHYLLALRQLIFLWYMGAWPTQHAPMGDDSGATETRGSTSFDTLASASYTSGLVWQVMQAHPMGDSNYRYGYWAQQPPALADFTGNTNDGQQ